MRTTWGNYYNTRPIGSNDPRPVFSSTEKVKIQCAFKSWGRGVSGSLVYIVYLMSGGTSLATQVGGTTLIRTPNDGRNFSGLPLDQKIKKSPSLAVRVGGPISYRGMRDRREEKKPPLPCGCFSQLEKRHWQMDPPRRETLPDFNYKRESP